MIRMSSPLRKSLSRAALAVSLATGGVVATAAFPSVAIAQEKPEFSKEWGQVVGPFQTSVNMIREDAAAAALVQQIKSADDAAKPALRQQLNTAIGDPLGMMDTVVAAASTPDDRFYTGNFVLNIGQAMSDMSMQQRGLKLMVDSGKTPADQYGLFNYYVGSIAYDQKDWATARTYLRQGINSGYYENDIERLLAETYFGAGDIEGGYAVVRELVAARTAAGSTPPEGLLTRAINVANDNNTGMALADQAAQLVQYYPKHWHDAIILTMTGYSMEPQETLDLFRLMDRTDSFQNDVEYFEYFDNLDPRRMSNEVLAGIADGTAAGILLASDLDVAEYKRLADARAGADRSEAASIEAEARGAATGVSARASGDVYFSLGNYAKAEEMYKLALEKGGVDRDRLLTRIGIAQSDQGKWADAKETMSQVGGKRLAVAKLWLTYIDQNAPAAPPATMETEAAGTVG